MILLDTTAAPVTIAAESPVSPDLALLFQRHTADMHADTPPESIHMMDAGQLENIQKMLFGALIIAFLIKEPEGLARLWQRFRQRARVWPLRY
mgnify:CR=1 FL=1